MQQLPQALAPMASYAQFLLYKIVPGEDKDKKIPINPHTLAAFVKGENWQKDPSKWTTAENAIRMAALAGDSYGVGFLFTDNDPFFFLDIDGCLNPDGQSWNDLAVELMRLTSGAAVEVSQSGKGLHVFGTGVVPEHACKNQPLDIELYTESRFVALTGVNCVGSAGYDISAQLPGLVDKYFPPRIADKTVEWTDHPAEGWEGPTDDDELIEKALKSKSVAGVFGVGSTLEALWEGDADVLAQAYPDYSGVKPYDDSRADAALAQHLAFWTGKDCERMLRMMQRSGLVRDKWEREDYLYRTIMFAVSVQEDVYNQNGKVVDDPVAEKFGAPKLRGSSQAQQNYAASIRAEKLQQATDDEAEKLCASSGPATGAKFWLDNMGKTPAELVAAITPIERPSDPFGETAEGPEVVSGFQYLSATLQIQHFSGCAYVQNIHKVFTPSGALLKPDQFNATYGGYVFQLDETGDKTTRKAWEAFTESQVVRWPKAAATCFRPEKKTGELIKEEGRVLVNTYVPIDTPRLVGDPAPFLEHLKKVLPDPNDQKILLSYMAACVQHKGIKFQWAPLIQGTEGNGKTLFTRCVAFAIGGRYTHMPPASEISEKFNDWLFDKLFIGIEDVYVPDHKKEVIEVLKPMITNDRLAMRAMQQGQVMGDNRANFMLNSNHKDGVRKSRNDRRFAMFYSAQQTAADLIRDGMTGTYFPDLYQWLREGGYAIVSEYLNEYEIEDEFNPATACHRAPETSTTGEAIFAGMGGIEQEILEAIEEGRPGFAGGWISSVAVDRLLNGINSRRAIPINKRRELLQSLGYDWHPALKDGRVHNPIPMDDNKKPRLFIAQGHISANIERPAKVAEAYQEAQGSAILSGGDAAEVFGNAK